MLTNPDLAALSAAATQGEWNVIGYGYEKYVVINPDGHEIMGTARKANAVFITTLVNEYRAGRLVQIDEGMRERLPGIIREAVMRRDSEPGDYADHAADAAIAAMMGGAK